MRSHSFKTGDYLGRMNWYFERRDFLWNNYKMLQFQITTNCSIQIRKKRCPRFADSLLCLTFHFFILHPLLHCSSGFFWYLTCGHIGFVEGKRDKQEGSEIDIMMMMIMTIVLEMMTQRTLGVFLTWNFARSSLTSMTPLRIVPGGLGEGRKRVVSARTVDSG